MKLRLILALFVFAATPADAQQANRQSVTRAISGYCQQNLPEDLRALIAKAGKSVVDVCDCTGAGMWKRFPGEGYWYHGSFPPQQINEAYGPVLISCIVN